MFKLLPRLERNARLVLFASLAIAAMSGLTLAMRGLLDGPVKERRNQELGVMGAEANRSESANSVASALATDSAARDGSSTRLLWDQIAVEPVDSLIEPSQSVSLSSSDGDPVVVLFWTSWCGYCKELIGWLRERQIKGLDDGIRLVLFNLDEAREPAMMAARELRLRAEIVMPKDRVSSRAATIAKKLPTLLAFDQERRLRCRFAGVSAERLAKMEACFRFLRESSKE